MNFSRSMTRPKPWTILAFAALVAALFALSLATTAGASGGIGTGNASTSSGSSKSGGKSEARYKRLWSKTSNRNKRWARKTARCESGGNPKAIGGGGLYRGAFQFMRSTWKTSPKSPGGDPINYTYKTQAVVAVKLKMRDGAGHWPVCG